MNFHGWKVPPIYFEEGKKVVPNSFCTPPLSLSFLLSCVRNKKYGEIWSGGGGQNFFGAKQSAQIKTRFACELKNNICAWNFCSYFHNFLFLKFLPPMAEILKPPLVVPNLLNAPLVSLNSPQPHSFMKQLPAQSSDIPETYNNNVALLSFMYIVYNSQNIKWHFFIHFGHFVVPSLK